MDKELSSILMGEFIEGNGKMIRKKDMEYKREMTIITTKETGLMVRRTAKE